MVHEQLRLLFVPSTRSEVSFWSRLTGNADPILVNPSLFIGGVPGFGGDSLLDWNTINQPTFWMVTNEITPSLEFSQTLSKGHACCSKWMSSFTSIILSAKPAATPRFFGHKSALRPWRAGPRGHPSRTQVHPGHQAHCEAGKPKTQRRCLVLVSDLLACFLVVSLVFGCVWSFASGFSFEMILQGSPSKFATRSILGFVKMLELGS